MKHFIFAVFIFLCSMSSLAFATDKSTDFNYKNFEKLPILHEGRIKPLESFARINLRQLSGKNTINHQNASSWLAETLFDPAQSVTYPVFILRNKNIKNLFELPDKRTTFTLQELQNGLEKTAPQIETLLATKEALTEDQNELLQLHEDALTYTQLLRSLSLIMPLEIDVPERYRKTIKQNNPSYEDLTKIEPLLIKDLKKLVQKKGKNPDSYNEEEQQTAQLGFQLQMFRLAAENNDLLQIVPVNWEGTQDTWVSPWVLMQKRQNSPETADYLQHWKNMATAYRAGNAEEFNAAATAALKHIHIMGGDQVSPEKLSLEILYNRLNPFRFALIFYGLCILSLLAIFSKTPPVLQLAGTVLGTTGIIFHAAGILMRIFVLERPPVGTLYESLLFVSLIVAAGALIFCIRTRNFSALAGGIIAASGLLLLAPHLLQQGESMEMLVAVLNTNFWLATHVICITIGYGICVLSACIAHIYLGLCITGKSGSGLENLQKNIYRTSLIALFFTAVGTVLGGIWADQSWGRFWGWDPKENGALLIVLWLVWLHHGRLSNHIRPLPFAAGMAALNIVVALAWFGVNLLSVGMHSYGFISGIATGLTLFCMAEIFLIGGLWFLIRLKERQIHVA